MGVVFDMFAIPLPSVTEQIIFATYLDETCCKANNLIAEKQKAAEVMRQYKKSLIYKYVTGKKRVASGGEAQ
jgi:type I restriction enzyme S subunit